MPGSRLLLLAVAFGFVGCSSLHLGTSLGEADPAGPRLPLERAWERDVQAAFGPSAPILTRQFVVVGTRRGEVVVLDLATGRVEGAGEVGRSVEGRLDRSPDGEVLFVPLAEEDGGVRALAVRNGARRWEWAGGPVQGGVLRVGDVLVVGTLAGAVVGLDALTGEERWAIPGAPNVQIHAAPVRAAGATVVVVDDGGGVRRIESGSGTVLWRAEVQAPAYETPAIAEGVVYVSTTRGTLHALDLETGQARWTHEVEGAVRLSAPAVSGDRLAVGTALDGVRLLDAATGTLRWRHPTDGNVSASPLWVGSTLLVGTLDERVIALDGETGEEIWSDQVRGRVKSALAAGAGHVVVLTEPRHVVAYRTADLQASR